MADEPASALDDFQQAVTDLDQGAVRGRAILVP